VFVYFNVIGIVEMNTEAKDEAKQQVAVGVGDVVGALDSFERHFLLLADCCIGMIELD